MLFSRDLAKFPPQDSFFEDYRHGNRHCSFLLSLAVRSLRQVELGRLRLVNTCERLAEKSFKEFTTGHRVQPYESCAVHQDRCPVHDAKGCLLRFVAQCLLRNQCAGPATKQAQKLQCAFRCSRGAPSFRSGFIERVCEIGDQADRCIKDEYFDGETAVPE